MMLKFNINNLSFPAIIIDGCLVDLRVFSSIPMTTVKGYGLSRKQSQVGIQRWLDPD